MATPLTRRPDSDGDSPMAVPVGPTAAEYLLPADGRSIAASPLSGPAPRSRGDALHVRNTR